MNICFSISEVNWSLTKDVISIFGTIAVVLIGIYGLSTWKKQLRGTSEYELAKKILVKSHQVAQAIQAVRSPMLFLNKEEVDAGNRLKEEQRIYDERLKNLSSEWAELATLKLEAKIIWSSPAEQAFGDLESLVRKIRSEIWLHFWLKGAYKSGGATVDNNPERVAANDAIVYLISDDDDFSQKIYAAVTKIELYFQCKVRST
ncbi:hypothetical protein [Alkalimonas mucilaginosa]|uniref:Uncharacterized protein n=1 Tax=Alkalimonas mucilaginosa TaxID=3057676 RepID=A0ABU7JIN1_9GAMM|nr:hypothetical protein [Alkalimonas sp. MEB004]MEE2025557.1 hypothetical protein [Alkalimonas sp. MEB004]